MVRMTDLVRGGSPAGRPAALPAPKRETPPAAPPEDTPAAGETPPVETAPPARPARLSLRALATTEPVRPKPVAPARPASSPEPADAGDVFARLLLCLERARVLVKTSEPFPWPELARTIERAIASLAQSGELFWAATSPALPPAGDPVAIHQARVAILALRVGADVGVSGARLVELGVAASLIDVGLWALGEGGRRLDPNSAEYRSHPRASAEIVQRWGPPAASLLDVIVQHHELEHGQGYPQGLRGDTIHAHAKIIGLCDRYVTLTASRTGRGRSHAHEAIRDIVRSKSGEFSPPLIKALLAEISIFPPGTPVRLNTGELARVIGVNRNHPLRPRVEVVADAKGSTLASARVIDLAESPFVYITGPATESR